MTRSQRAGRRHGRPPVPPRLPHRPAVPEPLTQRGRNTRAKLVAAARDIFSRVAFDEVRIADITGLAGVANGTFYTYFDSKEEIFREVAARALAEMSEAPRRPPGETERDPALQIEAATRRYFEAVRRNGRIAHSIEEIQARESGVGRVRRDMLIVGVKRIERWIRRLQDAGICPANVDPWATAQALHAMNVSVAYDHLVHRNAPDETEVLLRATTRIWCATLGLRPPG
jgi:AcrR family transcriptional regulator